jgi:hypothetical protein
MFNEAAPLAANPPVPIELDRVGPILTEAATEVLETMFFSIVEDVDRRIGLSATAAEEEHTETVELSFHGPHGGRFQVVFSEYGARALAANFIGATDPGQVAPGQVEQVLCEFANMVCGATLSRLAPLEIFHLETPRLCGPAKSDSPGAASARPPSAPAEARCDAALNRRLTTDLGWIDLYWCWEQAR